jgi:hydrogenase expression/formation protein HypC
MCLAVPARLVEIVAETPLRMGKIELGGVRRVVCLEHVPEAKVGDHVLVHVGFALCVVDEAEAARILETLREISALEESLGGEEEAAS